MIFVSSLRKLARRPATVGRWPPSLPQLAPPVPHSAALNSPQSFRFQIIVGQEAAGRKEGRKEGTGSHSEVSHGPIRITTATRQKLYLQELQSCCFQQNIDLLFVLFGPSVEPSLQNEYASASGKTGCRRLRAQLGEEECGIGRARREDTTRRINRVK